MHWRDCVTRGGGLSEQSLGRHRVSIRPVRAGEIPDRNRFLQFDPSLILEVMLMADDNKLTRKTHV